MSSIPWWSVVALATAAFMVGRTDHYLVCTLLAASTTGAFFNWVSVVSYRNDAGVLATRAADQEDTRLALFAAADSDDAGEVH